MTSGPVVIARRGRDPRSETEHEADMEGPQTTATARLVLGRYRIGRRLGAGGFGVVWQAWDEKLERDVAVKVVPREAGGDPARVEREARAAARLNHPAIVALYELAGDEHELFLVSELVTGSTLAELAKAGAVADRDVARLGATLCDALAHAHERGVIHRDVKPQNVMVLAEPAAGAGFAKLTDFGVAHVSAAADPLTHTGDVVGTLAYMAPEQAEGERVTPACDVYSLALTLYEAWTGSNPVRPPARPPPPAGSASRCPRSRWSAATSRSSSATRLTTRSSPIPSCGPRRPTCAGRCARPSPSCPTRAGSWSPPRNAASASARSSGAAGMCSAAAAPSIQRRHGRGCPPSRPGSAPARPPGCSCSAPLAGLGPEPPFSAAAAPESPPLPARCFREPGGS